MSVGPPCETELRWLFWPCAFFSASSNRLFGFSCYFFFMSSNRCVLGLVFLVSKSFNVQVAGCPSTDLLLSSLLTHLQSSALPCRTCNLPSMPAARHLLTLPALWPSLSLQQHCSSINHARARAHPHWADQSSGLKQGVKDTQEEMCAYSLYGQLVKLWKNPVGNSLFLMFHQCLNLELPL